MVDVRYGRILRGLDRCLGEKGKEQKKKKPTLKGGALKRGAQTGVWVEYSLMFQLCIIVGSYVDISSGYSNLLVLIDDIVKSVRKKWYTATIV